MIVADTAAKLSREERKAISNLAAVAVLGERFDEGVVGALKHPDFCGATRYYVDEVLKELRQDPHAVEAAQEAEKQRKAGAQVLGALCVAEPPDLQHKDDADYVEARFDDLVGIGSAGIKQSTVQLAAWAELFEKTDKNRLRDMAFTFQTQAWSGVVERTKQDKRPYNTGWVTAHSEQIFGKKACWSERAIKDAVKSGRAEGGERVGTHSFPKEIEDGLATFVRRLRELKAQVFRETVIDYAMRLLETHEARLNFAKVNAEGKDYVRTEEGHLIWDMVKLNHWYYRRFIGDRRQEGWGTGALRECEYLFQNMMLTAECARLRQPEDSRYFACQVGHGQKHAASLRQLDQHLCSQWHRLPQPAV